MNTSESNPAATMNELPAFANVTAVILAGGRSSRFGSDKASAHLLGRPLLDWALSAVVGVCVRVIVVRAKGQALPTGNPAIEFTVVEDLVEAKGPLAGTVAGFEACRTGYAFVAGCDSPLLASALVPLLHAAIDGSEVAAPEVGGRLQPLHALYDVAACSAPFRARLESGALSVSAACEDRRLRRVPEDEVRTVDPGLRSFMNANTPERLAEIAALLARR